MAKTAKALGDHVRAQREERGVSQEQLAAAIATNRSVVAHLEQGRRVPAPLVLEAICKQLGIPTKFWEAFLEPEVSARLAFEEALTELVGKPVSLEMLDDHAAVAATNAVQELFSQGKNETQLFDALRSVLVYYDVKHCSQSFFTAFFPRDAFASPDAFFARVREYQRRAIRLFSTFELAYEILSDAPDLVSALKPLEKKSDDELRRRSAWSVIETIPDERLPDLGYISAERARKEQKERQALATFLRDLAKEIRKDPRAHVSLGEKKKRRMESLLRKFRSSIEHGFTSPLFKPDPDQLDREADSVAPKDDKDLARIEETQATAQRNLAYYLAADNLDVYVATSMRSDADFVSVNRFCRELFKHALVSPLQLRYFNPTQSWIEDRIAKGLVEALMLKRSSMTLYMAQKSDTFGKDSEASVALGQGKPVIVFVPKLSAGDASVDSEQLGMLAREELQRLLAAEGEEDDKDIDESMDEQALRDRLITIRLGRCSDDQLAHIARAHWADFDLYGEDARIPATLAASKPAAGDPKMAVAQLELGGAPNGEGDRAEYRAWLDGVLKGSAPAISAALRPRLIGVFVAVASNFERRAKTFREQHPLALQVILSTGVLNGILVARSVDSCARLIAGLVANDLKFELLPEEENYRLVESVTRSTMRVISRHTLIGNAFSAFYKTQRASEPR